MRRDPHARIVILLATILIAAGCSQSTSGRSVSAIRVTPAAAGQGGGALATQQLPRQIVRTGRMGLDVDRVSAARARLESAAAALGAQVERVVADKELHAEYDLRVPPDRLTALMDSAGALGKVKRREVSATDVTESVVDAEARLTSLRASRDRLRQLLDRATTVQDVITVERELARAQGDVESLEGRLAAMRGQVALSDLHVDIERRYVLGPLGVIGQGIGTLLARLFVWR
ncbi:MAG TPA: DUF4349 domain-containing protein [Gemmatimonadaceae bacterium]|nr:DUF4349 domain-containing protein [Gemmatimonadaceae bacterium]